MATYHLYKWSVSLNPSPYIAPEANFPRLAGWRVEDDIQVLTSRIVKAEGRNVTTSSGSVYILEEIDPEYLKWMRKFGYTYNPINPIDEQVKPVDYTRISQEDLDYLKGKPMPLHITFPVEISRPDEDK